MRGVRWARCAPGRLRAASAPWTRALCEFCIRASAVQVLADRQRSALVSLQTHGTPLLLRPPRACLADLHPQVATCCQPPSRPLTRARNRAESVPLRRRRGLERATTRSRDARAPPRRAFQLPDPPVSISRFRASANSMFRTLPDRAQRPSRVDLGVGGGVWDARREAGREGREFGRWTNLSGRGGLLEAACSGGVGGVGARAGFGRKTRGISIGRARVRAWRRTAEAAVRRAAGEMSARARAVKDAAALGRLRRDGRA
ncbi:hypothetical protein B0H15DRAFT_615839 [Mycena belliarum]|uniref:Uncharacterized protein n=1 Tax=Mycena belliarum TaxID=1033014 RepID=A0AAD6TUR4_9AGAR|nr:hypothetical protein B0H15DRAFT_615839 [Mycena belliae]